jgi:protein-S-isoprenylcysteine O-methyltransferase Ste14/membrane-associated phospholipid phosphatase
VISTREKIIGGEAALESQHRAKRPSGRPAGVESVAVRGSSVIGEALYGLLFMVVIPASLIAWAGMTQRVVRLPALESPSAGLLMMLCGAALMVSGMFALIVYGKGLPMNAYPPVRYVTRGAYKLTSHPIYTGFSILSIGLAVATNSASGLWLVSPVVILGCVALVQGFEKHDLHRRFGNVVEKPLLRLPETGPEPPDVPERLAVYPLVLFPWLMLYGAVRVIGVPGDARIAFLPFERELRVYEWTELFYASTYAFVLLTPLVAKTKRDLREFSISGLAATAFITLLFLTVPLIAPPRPFEPHGLFGKLLTWERALDTPAAAFPSFHVVWALLAAKVYAARTRSWKRVWWGWAVVISISCITTGMHAVVDVLGGFAAFFFVTRIHTVWEGARKLTERIANSWREWRLGPVRVINHGLYAALGAFVSLTVVGTLTGPDYILPMLIIASAILIASAVWAQLVEGSPSLLRPYGWYGGVLGAVLGVFAARLLGASPWLLAGACSVAAPWLQSLGRLRCLVQGCCHGREAPAAAGIRYQHPRSRVCRLTHLAAKPIHPTPLYSILGNIVIAVVVARLWQLHAALSVIAGTYLILTGLVRFVEESYRGEPQTPTKAGLKLYQWMAVLSVLAGVLITTAGGAATTSAPEPHFNWGSVIAAACFSLFAGFALGVDFPNSNRRFARLA